MNFVEVVMVMTLVVWLGGAILTYLLFLAFLFLCVPIRKRAEQREGGEIPDPLVRIGSKAWKITHKDSNIWIAYILYWPIILIFNFPFCSFYDYADLWKS
jgi:hypothetical protein